MPPDTTHRFITADDLVRALTPDRVRAEAAKTRRNLQRAIRTFRHDRPTTQAEVCQNINAYWYERTHRG